LGHGGYRLHFFTGPMRAARNGPISNDVLADWGARIRGWLGGQTVPSIGDPDWEIKFAQIEAELSFIGHELWSILYRVFQFFWLPW